MAGLVAHGFALTELRGMTDAEMDAWTLAVNELAERAQRAREKD